MSNTKRSLSLLVFISLFVFTACNKSSGDSGVNIAESTMSFKLNGTAETFNNAVASVQVEDSVNIITITGLTGTDASKSLTIMVGSKGEISNGFTVTESSLNDDSTEYVGIVNYLEDSTAYSSLNVSGDDSTQMEIHITEKTSANVKGTFSVKLFAEESGISPYVVTEGKFNAKVTAQ